MYPCTGPCGERQLDKAPSDGCYRNGCCNVTGEPHSPLHPGPDKKPNAKAGDDARAIGVRKCELEGKRQPDGKNAEQQQLEHSLCRNKRGGFRELKAQKQIGPFVGEHHQIQDGFTRNDDESGDNAADK